MFVKRRAALGLLRALHNETAELPTLMLDAWQREVVMGVPGSADERSLNMARIVTFTNEHFVEHLNEILAIKEKCEPIDSS